MRLASSAVAANAHARRFGHLLLIGLQIEVKMRERMVLDLLGLLAKRVEFRERLARGDPSADEPGTVLRSARWSCTSTSASAAFSLNLCDVGCKGASQFG